MVLVTLQSSLPLFALEGDFTPINPTTLEIKLNESIVYEDIKDVLVNSDFGEVYGYSDDEVIVGYKKNAKEKQSINIEGYLITYYIGDNYIVVDEEVGQTLIMFENDSAYINGVQLEIQENESKTLNTLSGTLIRSHDHTFNVAAMSVSIIVGVVIAICPTLLKAGLVTIALTETIINFLIPDQMQPVVRFIHSDYMRVIDYFIGIYEYTYYNSLYYGTAASPFRNHVGSWTTNQTILQ